MPADASRGAARIARVLTGVLVAAGVLAGCGTVTTPQAAGPTTTATPQPSGIVTVRMDHREGHDGPVETVIVPRGATVQLVVGSDRAHRVLVPELGRELDVTAGGTVTIRFLALGTLSVRLAEPGAVRGGTVIGRVETRIL